MVFTLNRNIAIAGSQIIRHSTRVLSYHIFNGGIDGEGVIVGRGGAVHQHLAGLVRSVVEIDPLPIPLPDDIGGRSITGDTGESVDIVHESVHTIAMTFWRIYTIIILKLWLRDNN